MFDCLKGEERSDSEKNRRIEGSLFAKGELYKMTRIRGGVLARRDVATAGAI